MESRTGVDKIFIYAESARSLWELKTTGIYVVHVYYVYYIIRGSFEERLDLDLYSRPEHSLLSLSLLFEWCDDLLYNIFP